MNKDNARLYLPLVQALADGELQYFGHHGWIDWGDAECDFDRPPGHYRRKPKPRVHWLGFDDSCVAAVYPTEAEARSWERRRCGRTVAKFVEDVDSGKNGG